MFKMWDDISGEGEMNLTIQCGQCGHIFTAAYHPQKGAHCPNCRKNPDIKHRVEVKRRKRSGYVPVGLKVKIK